MRSQKKCQGGSKRSWNEEGQYTARLQMHVPFAIHCFVPGAYEGQQAGVLLHLVRGRPRPSAQVPPAPSVN